MWRKLIGLVGGLTALVPLWVWAVDAPDVVKIPPLKTRKAPPAAVFSHRAHDSTYCYACHPSIFPQTLKSFSHAQMQEGLYCGSCHNGHAAKDVKAMPCEVCHVAH